MSRGEEKSRPYRFHLGGLFLLVTSVGLSLGLMRIGFADEFREHVFAAPMAFAGSFVFGGTIGAFTAHICVGSDAARQIGFLIGGIIAEVALCCGGIFSGLTS